VLPSYVYTRKQKEKNTKKVTTTHKKNTQSSGSAWGQWSERKCFKTVFASKSRSRDHEKFPTESATDLDIHEW
jgi:hypothetical protein